MDPGIADTLNRQTARLIAGHLDSIDKHLGFTETPWYVSPIAASLMGETAATDGDRAWLIGALYPRTQGRFPSDGYPADGDWEMLFGNIRAEILARREARGTDSSPARAAEVPVRGMV